MWLAGALLKSRHTADMAGGCKRTSPAHRPPAESCDCALPSRDLPLILRDASPHIFLPQVPKPKIVNPPRRPLDNAIFSGQSTYSDHFKGPPDGFRPATSMKDKNPNYKKTPFEGQSKIITS